MTMKFSRPQAVILGLLTLTLSQSTAFAVWHGGPRDTYRQKTSRPAQVQVPLERTPESPSAERMPTSTANQGLESGRAVSSSNDAAKERTVYDEDSKPREVINLPHHQGGLEDR